MPRYYCDYCDTYLTHDTPSVRKQHNNGYKHKANVRSYYQQFEAQLNQTLIDQKIREHMGQAAAGFQQVGAAYNQMRPHLGAYPTPMMPMNSPLMPGIRPPVLPVPVPGYAPAPGVPPVIAPPPGAPQFPNQSYYGLQGHPTMSTLTTSVPGIASVPPTSSGTTTHSMSNFVTYQSNTAANATSGGGSQASDANNS